MSKTKTFNTIARIPLWECQVWFVKRNQVVFHWSEFVNDFLPHLGGGGGGGVLNKDPTVGLDGASPTSLPPSCRTCPSSQSSVPATQPQKYIYN
jgi:hypothetical protein